MTVPPQVRADDSTRYLCAAAHLDSAYADDTVREFLTEPTPSTATFARLRPGACSSRRSLRGAHAARRPLRLRNWPPPELIDTVNQPESVVYLRGLDSAPRGGQLPPSVAAPIGRPSGAAGSAAGDCADCGHSPASFERLAATVIHKEITNHGDTYAPIDTGANTRSMDGATVASAPATGDCERHQHQRRQLRTDQHGHEQQLDERREHRPANPTTGRAAGTVALRDRRAGGDRPQGTGPQPRRLEDARKAQDPDTADDVKVRTYWDKVKDLLAGTSEVSGTVARIGGHVSQLVGAS